MSRDEAQKGEEYWRERMRIEIEEAVLKERRRCAELMQSHTGMFIEDLLEVLGGMSCDATDYVDLEGERVEG